MEHKDIDQIRSLADVQPLPPHPLTRRERLERWAEQLERDPDRRLNTLGEIEYAPESERPLMRADNSPLTAAFEDPVLRAAGLKSDRLGDALAFFEISEDGAHHIMCSCLYGRTMSASAAAARIRSLNEVHWLVPAVVLAGMFSVPALCLHLLG
ncbi:hypothetical protein IC232_27170 [Microvirga sp. BT688]|uniref:hypothetical protein n=1 Tax=Microvirga sp. TaxID=1873136 RepID=UPI0016826D57|nr:hypothetical protein [Microvirga sp.]MBD2750345.1 hypothetical protein [Microvirga sp.]